MDACCPEKDPLDEAKWKLREIINSYLDIAFIEKNSSHLDGAIAALTKAKSFLDRQKSSQMDELFGGGSAKI